MDCERGIGESQREPAHLPYSSFLTSRRFGVAELNSQVAVEEREYLNHDYLNHDYLNLELAAELFRGTETILLVEDEAFVRKVTHEVLQSAGYGVVTAKNAVEAIEQRERSPEVDLLLTDVVLPGKNGRALASDLRSRQPNLPVLYVTGYPMQLAEIEATEPAEACLPKPFSAAALLRKVRQMLNGKNGTR
jgi:CheY-like chemotaxis protein